MLEVKLSDIKTVDYCLLARYNFQQLFLYRRGQRIFIRETNILKINRREKYLFKERNNKTLYWVGLNYKKHGRLFSGNKQLEK